MKKALAWYVFRTFPFYIVWFVGYHYVGWHMTWIMISTAVVDIWDTDVRKARRKYDRSNSNR